MTASTSPRDPAPPLLAAVAMLLLGAPATAHAQDWQDLGVVVALAREHVERSFSDPGGRLVVTVVAPDSRLRLPACADATAETGDGQRLWGWTQVRVRCPGERGWSLGVRTHVQVFVQALVTRRALPAGTRVAAEDIASTEVDLTASAYPPLRDADLVIGKLVRIGIGAGQPVIASHLKLPLAVRQGSPVEVVASIGQVTVTGSGVAQQDGAVGDLIRVRTPGGRTVQATVTGAGRVAVQSP